MSCTPDRPTPGRRGVATAALVAACAALTTAAAPAHAASSPAPNQAVATLNSFRASVSPMLQPVTEDPAQTRGCQLHAEHWRLNHETGHGERPDSPGYTDAGNAAAASSVLSYGPRSLGPYDWEEAPYHRAGLLNPRLATTGFWADYGISCMGVFGDDAARATPGLVVIPYPNDGRTGVEPAFGCNERPNPCDLFEEAPDGAGFGITVQFNGPGHYLTSPVITASSLVPDGREAEPYTVVDKTSPMSDYLSGGIALFPHRPLYAGTWYTAHVAGVWTGEASYDAAAGRTVPAPVIPFTTTWRFQTAGSTRMIEPTITARRQGRASGVRLEAGPAFAGARISVRVRPIRWVGGRYYPGRWSSRTMRLSHNGRATIKVSHPVIFGRRANGVQVTSRAFDVTERGGTVRLAAAQVWLRAR
jgi:hypothetical protein